MGAVLYGLGSLAIFFAMAYLFRATRARRPGMPQIALVLAAVGRSGSGSVARCPRSRATSAPTTSSTPSTRRTPRRRTRSARTATLVGQLIWQTSALALGFAFVLICAQRDARRAPHALHGRAGRHRRRRRRADPADRLAGHHPRVLAGRPRRAVPGPLAERHRPRRGPPGRPSRGRPSSNCASNATRRGPRAPRPRGTTSPDSARERARRAGDPAAHGSEPAPSRSRRRRQRARASKKKKRKRRS